MTTRRFAHISDLHLGRDAATDAAAHVLCAALRDADLDEILVTGDVAHHGQADEVDLFERIFAPVRERMILVPGNHDRAGDGAAARLLWAGPRVQVEVRPGLHVVRFDSTDARNRSLFDSHGELGRDDVAALEAAAAMAAADALVVVMLHHHVLPLPGDHMGESLLSWLGWPHAAELRHGSSLVERLRGRCDLVLHGHRHVPAERVLAPREGRMLRVVNAGSAPALGAVRVFARGDGRVVEERWLEFGAGRAGSAPPRRIDVRAVSAAA